MSHGKTDRRIAAGIVLAATCTLLCCTVHRANIGVFNRQTDIGEVRHAGFARFDKERQEYRITGSGENMWASADAFHFVWRELSGDLVLTANVDWVGTGGHEHRKAGWVVRQGLEADAPYADAVVHGDGLISLQFRKTRGGPTEEIQSAIRAPAALRLERRGDVFMLSVAPKAFPPQRYDFGAADRAVAASGGSAYLKWWCFHPACSVTVELDDPVHVGLAVCSHDAGTTETAVFSDVELENPGVVEAEDRMIESALETVDVETGVRTVLYRAREHFEAPNWSSDGKHLIFNSKGKLYTIPVDGGSPRLLDTGDADRCNNDHGLSPDGKWLALSHHHEGKSLIYIAPSEGGTPHLVTPLGPSYWHGWSPDGKTLAYCAERNGEYDVYTIPVEGGEETRLTTSPGLDDGPDYSPDGKYLYFNSERTGLMKIWRMRPDGSEQEQVTFDDEWADWFPHPSPDGKWLVFLSYDKSVKGHPPNKDVALRIMPLSGGEPKTLAQLFGGQGTLNVPSWSPDSRSVAFVSYSLVGP